MCQARGRRKGLEFQLEVASEPIGRELGRQKAVWNATQTLEFQRGLWGRRMSRKIGVKGQVLKFSCSGRENSRLSSGEIQSP